MTAAFRWALKAFQLSSSTRPVGTATSRALIVPNPPIHVRSKGKAPPARLPRRITVCNRNRRGGPTCGRVSLEGSRPGSLVELPGAAHDDMRRRGMANAPRMHDDEVDTDAALVRRLLAAQFPHWAGLAVEPIRSSGTDNAMYRLGGELAARLPRRPSAVSPIQKEYTWLPRLAPHLPLPTPIPFAVGSPRGGLSREPWSICRWLDGDNPTPATVSGRRCSRERHWRRSSAPCRSIDCTGTPRPGTHAARGAVRRWRDGRRRIAGAASPGWPISAASPPSRLRGESGLAGRALGRHPSVWIHGDLSAGNLLARAGRLSGVIDWGCLGIPVRTR